MDVEISQEIFDKLEKQITWTARVATGALAAALVLTGTWIAGVTTVALVLAAVVVALTVNSFRMKYHADYNIKMIIWRVSTGQVQLQTTEDVEPAEQAEESPN